MKLAKIDRDIAQIRILNSMRAFNLADDYFTYGHNSYHDVKYYHTLTNLAVTCCTNLPAYYNNYQDIFGDDRNFINTLIFDALEQKGLFEYAEDIQRTALTDSYLRYILMFLHPLDNIYGAYNFCTAEGSKDNAMLHWDGGAAHLIGSREGQAGSDEGILMHKLIRNMCNMFGTCDNYDLILLLKQGKNQIHVGNCDYLLDTVQKIETLLQITLIQNMLRYAVKGDLVHDDITVARGYAAAGAVIPLLYTNNTDQTNIETSIRTISFEMRFRANDDATPTKAARVFYAMKTAIHGYSGISCDEVGSFEGFGDICPVKADPMDENDGVNQAKEPEIADTSSTSETFAPEITTIPPHVIQQQIVPPHNIQLDNGEYPLAGGRYIATTTGIANRLVISIFLTNFLLTFLLLQG